MNTADNFLLNRFFRFLRHSFSDVTQSMLNAYEAIVEASYLVFPSQCLVCDANNSLICSRCFGFSYYRYVPKYVHYLSDNLVQADGSPRLLVTSGSKFSHAHDIEIEGSEGHQSEKKYKSDSEILSYYKKYGDRLTQRYWAAALRKNIQYIIENPPFLSEFFVGHETTGQLDYDTRIERIILIPVPGSIKAFMKRGFSPVEDLLDSKSMKTQLEIVKKLYGISVEVRHLLHLKSLKSIFHVTQKSLEANKRKTAQVNSMKVNAKIWNKVYTNNQKLPSLLIICDDVLTTGATLIEARRALEEKYEREQIQKTKRQSAYDEIMAITCASARY